MSVKQNDKAWRGESVLRSFIDGFMVTLIN
jgi:hypothetical protein